MAAPVETKVKASTGEAAVASAIVGLIILKVPTFASLNDVLEIVVLAVITAAATGISGWWAKHTPRPDLGQQGPTV